MKTRSRRTLGWVLLLGGSALAAGCAAGGVIAGDPERVDRYWARAEVASNGDAAVVEVIDYDFGNQFGRHGIERFIPGQLPAGGISVESPNAPDGLQLIPEFRNGREYTNIRIGDPNRTVTGKKRYRIDYRLPGVERDDVIDWEAVGFEWRVDIEDAEVHLITPYELADARCIMGPPGGERDCELTQVEPGHVMADVDKVPSGEGVSIEGRVGATLDSTPPLPEPPTSRPGDPGTGPGGAGDPEGPAGDPAATIVGPGSDGIVGTEDDVVVPATGTRGGPTSSGTGSETTGPAGSTTSTSTTLPPIPTDLAVTAVDVPSTAPASTDGCGQDVAFDGARVADDQAGTAWRMEGDGTGQALTLSLGGSHRIVSVGIIPGYALTDPCDGTDRFAQNRRITEVTWQFDDGSAPVVQDLRDAAEMQRVAVSAQATTVTVRIDGVTADPERDFTAISEIDVRGT